MSPAEKLARQFHEIYERLAPSFGYETRTETRDFDLESKNGKLMIAVCNEVITTWAGDLNPVLDLSPMTQEQIDAFAEAFRKANDDRQRYPMILVSRIAEPPMSDQQKRDAIQQLAMLTLSERNEIFCPYAKSDMTPCVIRDGDGCIIDHTTCVGCGNHISGMLNDLVRRHNNMGSPFNLSKPEEDPTSKEVSRLEYRGWVIQTFHEETGNFINLSGPGGIFFSGMTWAARARVKRPDGGNYGLFGYGKSEEEAVADAKTRIDEKENELL